MRQIKFRAWIENEDKMVYADDPRNYLLTMDGKNYRWDEDEEGGKYYGFKEKIKLMQYTGLKDKNNEEIYEGDVVKDTIYGKHAHTLVIEYRGGGFVSIDPGNGLEFEGLELEPVITDYDPIKSKVSVSDKVDTLKVIGNIYENKELLNV